MNSSSIWVLCNSAVPPQLAAVVGLVILAIMLTNILNLIAFRSMRVLKLQHYIMSSLAINDILTVCVAIPSMIGIWGGHLWLTTALCNIVSIVGHIVVGSTNWLHSVICIEKCFSILRPFTHRRLLVAYPAKPIAVKFTVVMYIVITFIMVVCVYSGLVKAIFSPSVATCVFHVDMQYFISLSILFIIIPMLVEVVTHILILNQVRKSGTEGRRRITRAVRTVSLTVGIYYICCMPFFAWDVYGLAYPVRQLPAWLGFAAIYISVSNSAMSFFIYIDSLKDFRRQLQPCKSSIAPRLWFEHFVQQVNNLMQSVINFLQWFYSESFFRVKRKGSRSSRG